MILENSMLSQENLLYLLKNKSISPLNNGKRYKGLNNYIWHEFGQFLQNTFFSIFRQKTKIFVNIRCIDVIKIPKPLKSWAKGLHWQKSLIFTKLKC